MMGHRVNLIAALVPVAYSAFWLNSDKVYKLAVERVFSQYEHGVLCVHYAERGETKRFGVEASDYTKKCDGSEMVIVSEKDFFQHVATVGGNLGLGEAYVLGYWTVPKSEVQKGITIQPPRSGGKTGTQHSRELMDMMAFNVGGVDADTSNLSKLVYHMFYNTFSGKVTPLKSLVRNIFALGTLKHWIERKFTTSKTRQEDRSNILFHYDIGNEFFRSYLGPTLSGSTAIWNKDTDTLEKAQENKWKMIIHKLDIRKGMHVLDVGCGWGYFCAMMNRLTGATCHGITLSEEQLMWNNERWKNQIEAGKIKFTINDYRDVKDASKGFNPGQFDRIVSVEMVEHVHMRRIQEYFDSLFYALEPGGKMLIHGISINDFFPGFRSTTRANACQNVNYIGKHIFPGGCLLHPDWQGEVAWKSGFIKLHDESFGQHYVKTLKVWHQNMITNWELSKAIHEEYDDKLLRKHEFYFAFCEAVFRITRADLYQTLYYKPKHENGANYSAELNYLDVIVNPNQN